MLQVRRALGGAYRLMMRPGGRRALRSMREEGLPESLARPLGFLFGGRPAPEQRKLVGRIESLRTQLARREDGVQIATGSTRTARWIAERSSIQPSWGMFLHLCAEAAGARTILELGSCAGVSGCYLASASTCERFVTVEGSAALADLARGHLEAVTANARVVNALFDEALEELLPSTTPIDLAYIDGDHKRESTLRYVHRLMPSLADDALVVLDDIHWSPEMWSAWTELSSDPEFRCVVNAGRLGLCLRGSGSGTPQQFDLSRYTGWVRVEQR